MKKIINGKKYDTETAKELACWGNAGSWSDFSHFAETLYQKRTGEFFLYGEGGPASRYAEQVEQNSWSGGEQIIPLDYKAAQEWAEEHLSGDAYEDIFGEVEEDDSRKAVSLSMAASTWEQAKRNASQKGISLSAYIEALILAD